MPPRDPTFWELVVEAFHRKPPSRRMGAVPWNKIALAAVAILGVGNPGFWLVGIAGELIYLYASATSPRFRNLIRARRLEAERTTAEQQTGKWLAELTARAASVSRRSRPTAARCSAPTRRCARAASRCSTSSAGRGSTSSSSSFLRLQVSLDLLQRQMGAISPRELQQEVEALRAELARLPETSEALKKSKQALLELKEKRLENLGRAAEGRQVLASELQRIEQQVELLREEAAISRNPDALSAQDRLGRQHPLGERLLDAPARGDPLRPRRRERTRAPPARARAAAAGGSPALRGARPGI